MSSGLKLRLNKPLVIAGISLNFEILLVVCNKPSCFAKFQSCSNILALKVLFAVSVSHYEAHVLSWRNVGFEKRTRGGKFSNHQLKTRIAQEKFASCSEEIHLPAQGFMPLISG